jgi:hypothetical protein
MRHAIPTILAIIVVVTLCRGTLSAAQIKSGPQAGEMVAGPFHYLNINGAHAGNPHCLVCEFGLCPAVLIFVRETPSSNSALAGLLQKLDAAIARYQNAELRTGVVVLSDDFANQNSRKDLIAKWESSVKDLKHILVAADGPDGPPEYKINKDAEVTVVLYQQHKVVANFGFGKDQLSDKDASAIMMAVNKMIGAK